jgi:hypothetical protein
VVRVEKLMKALVLDNRLFEPIKVNEERLENLLASAAPAAFSGFDYYEFKPRIRCRDGNRHPDGALLAHHSRQWWVVEVETHLHDPMTHIEPQLSDLMDGMYGPEAFRYLEKHDHFDRDRYDVDPYEPSFLLIIDSLTPEVEHMVTRLNLQVAECSVYFSAETNQFALALNGFRPHVGENHGPGISLVLEELEELALMVPADGRPMPPLKRMEILLGDTTFSCHWASASRGIVLPLTPTEVEAAISRSVRYKLITKTMRLVADPDPDSKP